MNIQEQISRIKDIMGVINESEDPIKYITKEITEILEIIKRDIPEVANKIIDTKSVINQFKNFLIGKIPSIIEKSKTGNGGEQFAYECYTKLMQLIDQEIEKVSWFNRELIRRMAPDMETFKKNSMNSDNYQLYFDFFGRVVDFPFLIGWMDEFRKTPKTQDKMMDYSNQITNWVGKNEKVIVGNITNKLIKFIYSK